MEEMHISTILTQSEHLAGTRAETIEVRARISGMRSYPFTEFPCSMGCTVNTQWRKGPRCFVR